MCPGEENADTYARLKQSAAAFANVECFNVAFSDRRRVIEVGIGATSATFGVG
jgi:hypothetical protein